jgi:hypothetical protein
MRSESKKEHDDHQKPHQTDPAFSCPFCDRRFDTNGELGAHVDLHHPERPEGLEPARKATGAEAAFDFDKRMFLDNLPGAAKCLDTLAGYVVYKFPDGTIRTGPIGTGYFGD